MGEAKRRQQNDPSYGIVPQKRKKTSWFKFDPKRITRTEMLMWAALFTGTAAVFFSTYFLQ